jgi:hypothetical protein
VGRSERHSIFPEILLFWGAPIVSTFSFDGPIKLAHCNPKKKIGLVRHPQLIPTPKKVNPTVRFRLESVALNVSHNTWEKNLMQNKMNPTLGWDSTPLLQILMVENNTSHQ